MNPKQARITVAVGGGLVILGAFLPWATAGLLTVDGMRGDGVFALILGIGIVGIVAGTYNAGPSGGARGLLVVLAILSIGLYITEFSNVSRVARNSDVIDVEPGTGLIVGALGGLIALLFATATKAKPEPATQAQPRSASNSADQLRALADMRDRGLITADEYEAKKADLLGRM